jgi:hypothetical protein
MDTAEGLCVGVVPWNVKTFKWLQQKEVSRATCVVSTILYAVRLAQLVTALMT